MNERDKKQEVEELLAATRALDGANLQDRVQQVLDKFRLLDEEGMRHIATRLSGRLHDTLGHLIVDLEEMSRG